MRHDDEVTGWRFDYMTPLGWHPWSAISMHSPNEFGGFEFGWYARARAVCLEYDHTAPAAGCSCGYYCVTEMSEELAQQLDWLNAARGLLLENTKVPPDWFREDWFTITLSRVTVTNWRHRPKRATWSPGDDPPGTVRAERLRYDHIMVDREWPAETVPQDERLKGIGFPAPEYVPDLAEWVRAKGRAEIDAILDDYLEGQA